MPEIDLDSILGREPVVGPCLHALTITTDPAAHKVFLVGITTSVSNVIIKKAPADGAANWKVSIYTLDAEIELRRFGQMRKIESRGPSGSIPVSHRTDLIICKTISIKCCPVAQEGQPIGEIKAGAAIPGSRDEPGCP